jgi:hypothetical protein
MERSEIRGRDETIPGLRFAASGLRTSLGTALLMRRALLKFDKQASILSFRRLQNIGASVRAPRR